MYKQISYLISFFLITALVSMSSCRDKENHLVQEKITFIPSADTRLIYISQDGDDATGEAVEALDVSDPYNPEIAITPFKTIKVAMEAVRDGYPDWILLKRGDVWTNESIGSLTKSGRGASEPLLITYYGAEGERPLIKTGDQTGLNTNGRVTSNIAIIGIDLYAHTRDPNSPNYVSSNETVTGLRFVGGGKNILIEDCVIRFFNDNIVVQSYDGNVYENFTMRRNMVLDSYSNLEKHSQGIYISGVDGILIEENLFDHNGWNTSIEEAEATKFNHNMYIQWDNVGNNIEVRNNISSRASSTGILGRPGGLYEDNLFVENSISLQFGYHDHPLVTGAKATARNNVLLGGKLMDPENIYEFDSKAVWGVEIDPDVGTGGIISIERNIIAHAKHFDQSNMGIAQRDGVNYAGNIIYKWHDPENMNDPNWSNPELSVGTYMESLGLSPTFEAFIEQCRSRKLNEWDSKFTAPVVNGYIRAGFNFKNSV